MSSAAHGLGDQVLGRDCIGASPLEEAEEEVEVVEDPLPVVEAADRVENSASHDEVASRHAGVGCDDIIGAQAFRRTPGVGTGRVAVGHGRPAPDESAPVSSIRPSVRSRKKGDQ